jgi:hypothetical protein
MRKMKYIAVLAVVVLVVSTLSVMSTNIGGKQPPVDGNTTPIYQTTVPPTIDGTVYVPGSWPGMTFVGYMWIRNPPDDVMVAEVYAQIDWLSDPLNPYVEPASYDAADWTGFYLYIGIKALPGFTIGDEGNFVLIDWDQDGTVDFADHNGNSVNPGLGGYPTLYGHTDYGTEWAIPYFDDYSLGPCESPFDIMLHIEATGDGYTAETATYPQRDKGPFLSTTWCPWELIEPEPPEPGDYGLRTIGFWKHQLRCALGICTGHQHVPTDELIAALAYISGASTIPELQDMGTDMAAALALLELKGQHPMYDRAVQQLLAVWLNYAFGETHADLDGDGVFETSLWQVIQDTEAALLDGDPTNDEYYKDLCDAVNNSGPE